MSFLVHLHIKKIFKVHVHTAKPKELRPRAVYLKKKKFETVGYLKKEEEHFKKEKQVNKVNRRKKLIDVSIDFRSSVTFSGSRFRLNF